MRLAFEYTFNDYKEANAAWKTLRLALPNLAVYFYLFVAFLGGATIGNLLQPPAPGETPRGFCEISLTSMPLMFGAAYWAFLAFRPRRPAPGFIIPPERKLSGFGLWMPAGLILVVFVACVAGNALTAPVPSPPPPAPPPPGARGVAAIFMPLLPVVGFIITMLVAGVRMFQLTI